MIVDFQKAKAQRDDFRRAKNALAVIDILDCIEGWARAEAEIPQDTPFNELSIDDQDILNHYRSAFANAVAAELMSSGKPAEEKLAARVLTHGFRPV